MCYLQHTQNRLFLVCLFFSEKKILGFIRNDMNYRLRLRTDVIDSWETDMHSE